MGYIHFFDDWQLISYSNLVRKQGSPRYRPEATLVDGLTEGTWNFPLVTYLAEQQKYIGLYGGAASLPIFNSMQIPEGVDKNLKPRTQVLCYAESKDGINWDKPDLTSRANFGGETFVKNQVFGLEQGYDGGPATYDPYDPDPQRRFKYLINFKDNAYNAHGIRAMVTSGNGIDWKIEKYFKDQHGTDTPTSIFYNPLKECYSFNIRYWSGDRRIFFMNTKDFENFGDAELIMHPDSMDEPLVGFYGMPVAYYEGLFVGLLWKIYCDPATQTLANGKVNCELVYSYDGSHFNRAFRQPFIDTNELGDHGGGCVYTGSMVVTPENTIRFYSGGSKAEHFQNQELEDAALMMHEMRLDGFMYMATPSGRGRLRTRPLRIHGDSLKINARSPWGYVKVRVLDENAKVIEGYDFDDCIPLVGDELFWEPKWKNGKTIAGVKSHLRRSLEIEINTGEIFGIRGDFERLKCLWDKD
ncbi:MAG: hypothetical protein ACIAQZ_04655 [Sedimentisphaeraceae bacterium JB056]